MPTKALVTEDDGTGDVIFPKSDKNHLVYGDDRDQFFRWLGSFPMHDDDRGPDNTVLIDLLPAGVDFGEAALRRLAEAMLWRADRLLQIEKQQNDAELLTAVMGLNDALDEYWNSHPRTDDGIKRICEQQQRCKTALLNRRAPALCSNQHITKENERG